MGCTSSIWCVVCTQITDNDWSVVLLPAQIAGQFCCNNLDGRCDSILVSYSATMAVVKLNPTIGLIL